MTRKSGTRYEEFEEELLSKPQIRKEYEALKPKYEMVRQLIERRIKLHMSQTELARIVGTKQPAISRLEKGDYNTTLSTLSRVAEALDLELDIYLKPRKTTRLAHDRTADIRASTRKSPGKS